MGIILSMLGINLPAKGVAILSKVLLFIALGLAIAGAVASIYLYGKHEGYKIGYKEAFDSQQKVVNLLTDKINDKTRATNEKAGAIEQLGVESALDLVANTTEKAKTREEILKKHESSKAEPADPKATQCSIAGLSATTVTVINELLDTQNIRAPTAEINTDFIDVPDTASLSEEILNELI
jgi:hypothetical protein